MYECLLWVGGNYKDSVYVGGRTVGDGGQCGGECDFGRGVRGMLAENFVVLQNKSKNRRTDGVSCAAAAFLVEKTD